MGKGWKGERMIEGKNERHTNREKIGYEARKNKTVRRQMQAGCEILYSRTIS